MPAFPLLKVSCSFCFSAVSLLELFVGYPVANQAG